MLALAEEDYHVVQESVQNDPGALILDMNGLLIHKLDLEEDMFFPTWNLQYDQGNCCIVPVFGSPNDTTRRPFLTHKIAPCMYKYLKARDITYFVTGGGDVFGTWGSEEDLIVKDLIELHG
ncbi:hypothetical protein GOP47_0009837 [Adiantum capillus-veneris]|uniref:Uncharacterized protein n=1 Tax=Adiantum capillus-veneris TaxID=13818 RepID=A0A9D4ZJV3_ADICA|nr:hypothetical protein GOP47_0009837 [Adiantum capillus-veneris]